MTKFEDKYPFLFLKSVVASKKEGECVFTFFYPASCKNLSDAEKNEIIAWIKDYFKFEGFSIKVKFLKAYIEEKLIRKCLEDLIKTKFKLLSAYITQEDITVEITNLDVKVTIKGTDRIVNYAMENKIQSQLAAELKENFLTEFIVVFSATEEKGDEVDLESVPLESSYRTTARYNVEVIKDIVGSGITPKPEFLSGIKSPKNAVIVAGFVSNFARKEYLARKGKHIGENRTYYTFTLNDDNGKMECVFFSARSNEKRLDGIEDCMYLLLHGDVRVGVNRKLTLYADKIALATRCESEEGQEVKVKPVKKQEWDIVENITSTEQSNMFTNKRYTDKIAENTIVVFDLETTGLDIQNDEIIELGAVKIVKGDIVERFNTFVKPENPIPESASSVNHITDDMVADAPPIEYVIEKFYEFCDGAILCGHNVIGFDIKFLQRFGEMCGYIFDNELIDTMNEVRNSNLKISRLNLGTVTRALGIDLTGAHRAWNDAFATAKVLLKLNEL